MADGNDATWNCGKQEYVKQLEEANAALRAEVGRQRMAVIDTHTLTMPDGSLCWCEPESEREAREGHHDGVCLTFRAVITPDLSAPDVRDLGAWLALILETADVVIGQCDCIMDGGVKERWYRLRSCPDNAALLAEWKALRELFEYVDEHFCTPELLGHARLCELVSTVEAARK